MNKKLMIICSLFFILGMIISYIFLVPILKEDSIKKQIVEANYCSEDLDCIDAGGKCPFDCYVYVNKKEVNKISKLIQEFDSRCVYNCISCQGAICENNKCKQKCELN